MSTNKIEQTNLHQVLDIIVRLGVVLILLIWSFQILKPFILPVVWGIILAVACFPGYQMLLKRLGGRKKLSACLICAFLMLLIILPSWLLADSLVSGVAAANEYYEQETFHIPPPTEQVKQWPLLGERIYQYWLLASKNLEQALRPLAPHLKTLAGGLLSAVAGIGFAVLQFVFSIIIAGVLLASAERGSTAASTLSERIGSARGLELLKDAETTVRNVARGILGVALIQAILAGIGFVAADLPGAGLWALVSLIFGIIQIGVGPVLLVAVIYLFATASTLTASLFLVWTIIVVPLDNILKPMLLGKGAPVPMLVIFLGALGGFINSGIIGLFVGAVVLSLAYKLLLLWVQPEHYAK